MTTSNALPWQIHDIDWSLLQGERVAHRDALFVVVCGASFTESGSDTYSRNLIDYFADDDELSCWLNDHWEPEELQHGRALRAYLQRVWPDFDWERAYRSFFSEYSQRCAVDQYEPTRAQELAARCIVEMGTTTFYQTLATVCDEPLLRELTGRIRTDEVQHYKHFYRHFLGYREREGLGWHRVVATIARRVLELRRGDTDIAMRHAATAWLGCGLGGAERPGPAGGTDPVAELIHRAYRMMSSDYPMGLAVRMALKPLQLQPFVVRLAERPLAALARHQILR